MQEPYKPIPMTNDRYIIYRDGSVKNTKTGKFIVGDTNNLGYRRVSIPVDGKLKHLFRHRLVATAFIPNPDNLPEVDHLDGNKDHNDVDNLRWVDRSENERAARRNGLKAGRNAIEIVMSDGSTKAYETSDTLAKELGLTPCAVRMWLHPEWMKRPNRGYRKYGITSIRKIGFL